MAEVSLAAGVPGLPGTGVAMAGEAAAVPGVISTRAVPLTDPPTNAAAAEHTTTTKISMVDVDTTGSFMNISWVGPSHRKSRRFKKSLHSQEHTAEERTICVRTSPLVRTLPPPSVVLVAVMSGDKRAVEPTRRQIRRGKAARLLTAAATAVAWA